MSEELKCSEHPDAPHGFSRNASHNAGRYVCVCEGWLPSSRDALHAAIVQEVGRDFWTPHAAAISKEQDR
jgi:hypothetical protein